MVSSLIGTIVFLFGFIARGFDPRVGFPLVRCFAIGHNIFMPMLGSSRYCEEPGGCRCKTLRNAVTVTCRLGICARAVHVAPRSVCAWSDLTPPSLSFPGSCFACPRGCETTDNTRTIL